MASASASDHARQRADRASRGPAYRTRAHGSTATGPRAGVGVATTCTSSAGGGLGRARGNPRIARDRHPCRDHRPQGSGGDVAGGGPALCLGRAVGRAA